MNPSTYTMLATGICAAIAAFVVFRTGGKGRGDS